jgi:hypothetical protein
MTLFPIVALLAGCTPQDGEVTANYAVYLAAASSQNLTRMERQGTDVAAQAEKLGLEPIDCRDLTLTYTEPEEIEAARLDGVNYAADCCEGGDGEECDGIQQPKWFGWMDDYAYYVREGKVDPYRVEAVITTEGDLQLTVHMDVPGFGDFRFGWVVDPDFQPTECVDGAEGAELVNDQGDWLTVWNDGAEGQLWHLNAGAFQINPSNQAVGWYFDQDWAAGTSFARFADEEFYSHPIDYADELYRPFHVDWYADSTCSNGADDDLDLLEDDADPDCANNGFEGASIPESRGISDDASERYETWRSNVATYFAEDVDDLSKFGKSDFPLAMQFENNNNAERPVDGTSAGLDGWLGVSPSWVRIDNPGAIQTGRLDAPITGEFQIYLEGVAAASKLLVGGSFSIDNVREDVWGYEKGTMEALKAEENNTPACGEEGLSGPLYEY